jgi:hypothetical protein
MITVVSHSATGFSVASFTAVVYDWGEQLEHSAYRESY